MEIRKSILWILKIKHPYYWSELCQDVELSPCPQTNDLLKRRGYRILKATDGEWYLMDLQMYGIVADEHYRFFVKTKNNILPYITVSGILLPENAIKLRVDNINSSIIVPDKTSERITTHPGSIFDIDLQLHCKKNNDPVITEIQLPVAEYFWEYLFVNRYTETRGRLSIYDISHKIPFDLGIETEYKGMKAVLFRSLVKIPCSERYGLNLTLTEGVQHSKRVLMHKLPFPQPGMYLDAPPDTLRKVWYL